MKFTAWVGTLALLVLLAYSTAVEAVIIKTLDGNGADAEIGERPNDDRGNGTSDTMNARFFVGGDRNENLVMRFDLTGVDFNNIGVATLNLTHFRDNSSQRTYMVYGVNDGAMGGDNNGSTPGYDDNTWDEGSTVMSTMPGLVYDGDAATQGINGADTTLLGTGSFSDAVEGDLETIGVPGLLTFLSNHPDDLVTLIVARDPTGTSTGQDRFATKEAAALTTITGSAGDFAPYLHLMVPEPTSLMLAGIAGLALVALRRRAIGASFCVEGFCACGGGCLFGLLKCSNRRGRA